MKLIFLVLVGSSVVYGAFPSVGPDFDRPSADVPAMFRDISDGAVRWKNAESPGSRPAGRWWSAFGDARLDGLIERSLAHSQSLTASAARVAQARAVAGIARSEYFPLIGVDAGVGNDRNSRTIDNVFPQRDTKSFGGSLDGTLEIDFFGRVRRINEAARADAHSAEASYEAARLTVAAEVATQYFSLRGVTEELEILDRSIALRRSSLKMLTARAQNGEGSELDVSREKAELATTEAETAALQDRRASLDTALSVLLGVAPQEGPLTVAPLALDAVPPEVPPGLPGSLLERRADLVAAQADVEAANARIGVAKAAFFPAIALTGSTGFESADVHRLFEADSRVWSVGPTLYLPIFQGGRNRANLERNRAAFDANVAVFRQSVLVALKEVQDALDATWLLSVQAAAQRRAVAAAGDSLGYVQARYEAGAVNYFEVIDSQRTELAAERALAQVSTQKYVSAVELFRSLGGGWGNTDDGMACASGH